MNGQMRLVPLTLLGFVLLISIAFIRVLQPFLLNLVLAAVFAGVFYRLFTRIRDRFGGRKGAASAVTVLLALIIIGVPLSLISTIVISEARAGYNAVREALPGITESLQSVDLDEWLASIPVVGDFLATPDSMNLEQMLQNGIQTASQTILEVLQGSIGGVTSAVASLVVIFFVMFFLFLDGERLLSGIREVLPVPNRDLDALVTEVGRTTSATLVSSVIIGAIEATYAVILFLIFGLPSPFLWGVITLVVSLIPLIGANLVLIPAAVLLAIVGRFPAAVLLGLLSVGGVFLTQNVLKPKLLGDRSGLHPAVVLFATLGGIAWLGLAGFVLGPIIAALFFVIWQQFGIRFQAELSTKDDNDSGEDAEVVRGRAAGPATSLETGEAGAPAS